ncbi:MAG: hypothetical protein Kow0079_17800 [Vicingaceae bacterium]
MMKYFTLFIFNVFVFLTGFTQSIEDLNKQLDNFFSGYVIDGKVNYKGIAENDIHLLATRLATSFTFENDTQKTAFYINAYNFFVIKKIKSHYPIDGPKSIPDFFTKKDIAFNGQNYSLNELEKACFKFSNYNPLLHFVLICGAKGCPPIQNFAFTSENLYPLLFDITKNTLKKPYFLRIDKNNKTVYLSEIFKWYEDDFLKTFDSLLEFLKIFTYYTFDENYIIRYQPYDWSINDITLSFNIQSYTPSVLLHKAQMEIKVFNNLYTQTATFNPTQKTEQNFRSNYYTGLFQFLYGVNNRINIGFDAWVKSVYIDFNNQSPLKTFSFENSPNARTALSLIGPKVKIAPLKKWSGFSIQSTVLFLAENNQESIGINKPYLNEDKHLWLTQFFYDAALHQKFRLFAQNASWFYFKQNSRYANQNSLFLSWFINDKWSTYWMNDGFLNFSNTGISSYYLQEGIGVKYQIIIGLLETEILYSKFVLGKNTGAGETFNLGLRLIVD